MKRPERNHYVQDFLRTTFQQEEIEVDMYIRALETYGDDLEKVRCHLDERNIYLNSNTPDPETIRKANQYDKLMEDIGRALLNEARPKNDR